MSNFDISCSKLKSISLRNFRSIVSLSFDIFDDRLLLKGRNGSGKTSILEAISLFGNDISSFYYNNHKNNDLINSDSSELNIRIEMNTLNSISLSIDRRFKKYLINDKKIEKQDFLSSYINIYGLKPHDQYQFLDKKSKRDFFERIVGNISLDYVKLKKQYIILCKQRINTLEKNINAGFLSSIEAKIVDIGIDILIIRNSILLKSENKNIDFHYRDSYKDFLDEDISIFKKDDLFVKFTDILKQNRYIDGAIGRMKFSFHRFDFDIIYSGRSFNQISNSEQKESIYELFMSGLSIFREKLNLLPILLIDEVDAFFDDTKMENFAKKISSFEGQIIFTSPFERLSQFIPNLQIINLDHDRA